MLATERRPFSRQIVSFDGHLMGCPTHHGAPFLVPGAINGISKAAAHAAHAAEARGKGRDRFF